MPHARLPVRGIHRPGAAVSGAAGVAARELLRLAVALLARLGFPVRPLTGSGPLLGAPVVPLIAAATWLPVASLGIPGDYTPAKGGAP